MRFDSAGILARQPLHGFIEPRVLPVKTSGGKLCWLHSLVCQDEFVSKLAKDKSKGGPGDSYEGWAVDRFCKPLDDRVDVCAFRGAYIDRTFQIGLEEEGQGSGFVGKGDPRPELPPISEGSTKPNLEQGKQRSEGTTGSAEDNSGPGYHHPHAGWSGPGSLLPFDA